MKTFKLKKAADQFSASASIEVRDGIHVAERDTATVKQAAALWLKSCDAAGLEQSSLDQYRQHINLHIEPFLASTRLNKLTTAVVRSFQEDLRVNSRSPAMVKRVTTSLGSILSDAMERGLIRTNVVRNMSSRRRAGEQRVARRQKGKLKIGVDIPTREEIRAVVAALSAGWRPLLTAIFCGLRASELHGLRWVDVDLDKREIHVRQRADRYNKIGPPKSESGERAVPMPPIVVNALREWVLSCPRPIQEDGKREPSKQKHLVFPNGSGNGKPILKAKYTSMHCLRHFYALWLINRREDGGLGLPLKTVQERMGHSSVMMTADTYGHLFPHGDDADELAAAESALLA